VCEREREEETDSGTDREKGRWEDISSYKKEKQGRERDRKKNREKERVVEDWKRNWGRRRRDTFISRS